MALVAPRRAAICGSSGGTRPHSPPARRFSSPPIVIGASRRISPLRFSFSPRASLGRSGRGSDPVVRATAPRLRSPMRTASGARLSGPGTLILRARTKEDERDDDAALPTRTCCSDASKGRSRVPLLRVTAEPPLVRRGGTGRSRRGRCRPRRRAGAGRSSCPRASRPGRAGGSRRSPTGPRSSSHARSMRRRPVSRARTAAPRPRGRRRPR